MQRKPYSAGAVKLSFWFMEFKKAVGLLDAGADFDEVRRRAIDENLFGAPTSAREKQICNTVLTRIKSLDESFYPIFMESDLATQKLFCLVAVMASDTLFFDLVYEVIREKLIIGSDELADSDVRVFFNEKQTQDERAATWTDYTLGKLATSYKSMLYEAGLIGKSKNVRKIYRPIPDPTFERWLREHGLEAAARAFAGVR